MLTLTGFGFTPVRATNVTPQWTPAPPAPTAPVTYVPPSPPINLTPMPPPPPMPVQTIPGPGPVPPPPPVEPSVPGAGPQITQMPSEGPFDLFSWDHFAWWKPVAVASVIAIFGGTVLALFRLRK